MLSGPWSEPSPPKPTSVGVAPPDISVQDSDPGMRVRSPASPNVVAESGAMKVVGGSAGNEVPPAIVEESSPPAMVGASTASDGIRPVDDMPGGGVRMAAATPPPHEGQPLLEFSIDLPHRGQSMLFRASNGRIPALKKGLKIG